MPRGWFGRGFWFGWGRGFGNPYSFYRWFPWLPRWWAYPLFNLPYYGALWSLQYYTPIYIPRLYLTPYIYPLYRSYY